jgi:pimeloyl-ACP methyl ester carboxylesterase
MTRGGRVVRRLAALLLAGAAAGACAADAGLKPCRLRGLEHEALCGVVRRPLDPAQPHGPQIDVHYAVLPALARSKKPDPVFFFAGGPGQSAIDLAGPVAALFSRFSNRRDLVLVDQRGTGRSAPLKCDDDDPGRPIGQMLDPAQQAAALARCREALQRLPHGDLRQYTTTIAVQDVDAVRAALGVERLDAIGASYGTRAVLEYQRQFPQRVRRAVIDGVAPPDMVLPASFSTDNQAALDAMFAACDQEPACRQRHPALRAQWEQLLASLPRHVAVAHPLTGLSERITVTRELVLAMVRLPLYVPALAAGLPQAVADAAAGRFEALAALASGLQGRRKAMALAEGMHFSVVCAEDLPRMDAGTDAPGRDFGQSFAQLYRQVCAQWPRGAVPQAFYQLNPAPAATLVLSGAIDPVTPPRHGERVAHALGPKARHVVVPNAGHGVMAVGCMSDVVFRFVDAETDEQALKVDAQCVQQLPRPPAAARIAPPVPSASGAAVPPVRTGAAR